VRAIERPHIGAGGKPKLRKNGLETGHAQKGTFVRHPLKKSDSKTTKTRWPRLERVFPGGVKHEAVELRRRVEKRKKQVAQKDTELKNARSGGGPKRGGALLLTRCARQRNQKRGLYKGPKGRCLNWEECKVWKFFNFLKA